jgi:hypothetical protein
MDRRESLKDRQLVELGPLIPRAKKVSKFDLKLKWLLIYISAGDKRG